MHGREHAVAIRAARDGLILHTLFYANEVRADEVRADEAWRADAPVNEKELGPAAMLVESRAATPATNAAPKESAPPAIDIMEALRKSIAAARKPVTPERAVNRERRRRA